MTLASEEDIDSFVDDATDYLGDRLKDVLLYGSYARNEEVPGSDVDILFLVDHKEEDDWEKISKIAGDYFLDNDVRFSPKIVEKEVFEERKDESAGFYHEVSQEGIQL